MEMLAEGLRFPEGPIAMPDGSVILVEIAAGTLTRIWNGRREVVATPGGGPNGAAVGPDGAVYVCNNGGFEYEVIEGLLVPRHIAHDYAGGRIERVDLATGKVERLYSACGEHPLKGPNDIVFDAHGNFYFTDYGKDYDRHRDFGGVYYAAPDGTSIVECAYRFTSPNGIGLSPDGKAVYVADTFTGRVWALDVEAPGKLGPAGLIHPGRCLMSAPGYQLFDSLAVEAGGKVCVATIINGGVTIVDPADGSFEHMALPDLIVTNLCFGGADLQDAFVTLSGTGKLLKLRWPRPGLKLKYCGLN